MNKLKPLIIILVILVVGFFVFNGRKGAEDASNLAGDAAPEASEEKIMGSFMDIMNLGRATKCVAEFSSDGTDVVTTVYASGGKSYLESKISAPEIGEMMSYVIFDGDWMYTWGDQGVATKMSASELEKHQGDDVDSADPFDGNDYNESTEVPEAFTEDFEYDCSPWVPNAKKFIPPADLEFVDFTKTINDLTEAYESGNAADLVESGCAVCDLIPDEAAAAECRVNVGC